MEYKYKDLASIEEVRSLVDKAKKAQKILASYSQEQLDKIVEAMSMAARAEAERLAKLANQETGYGKWEDKVIKNLFAAVTVYERIKNMKTVGIVRTDYEQRISDIAVPVGVIAGLIPSTNPTSTVIYKSLISVKAGNSIVFSPHPSAKECISQAVKVVADAAVRAGAPEGTISCLSILTVEGTDELLKHKDINLILATGGEAMVHAAYSSGNPAIGVGPGNSPVFIERSADIPAAVRRIIASKTFDNGVICASEQAVITERDIKETVMAEFRRQGGYFLSEDESKKLGAILLRPNKTPNPACVGRDAEYLARLAGFTIPPGTKLLLSEQTTVSKDNPFSREKLTTALGFYTEDSWESACELSMELLNNEGAGHTLSIHSANEAIIKEFALKKSVSRVLVNTPGALGGIGATTNMEPALTLGCGAVGGSSTSDNVGPMNLLNYRRLAFGAREAEDVVQSLNPSAYTGGSATYSTPAGTGISNMDIQELVKELLKRL